MTKITNQNVFILIPPPKVLLLLTSNGTNKTCAQAKVNPKITLIYGL